MLAALHVSRSPTDDRLMLALLVTHRLVRPTLGLLMALYRCTGALSLLFIVRVINTDRSCLSTAISFQGCV